MNLKNRMIAILITQYCRLKIKKYTYVLNVLNTIENECRILLTVSKMDITRYQHEQLIIALKYFPLYILRGEIKKTLSPAFFQFLLQ